MSETILVNGRPVPLPPERTVAAVVARLLDGPGARGVAVAVGDEVVPRASWATRPIAPGDRVEVVTAVPGG